MRSFRLSELFPSAKLILSPDNAIVRFIRFAITQKKCERYLDIVALQPEAFALPVIVERAISAFAPVSACQYAPVLTDDSESCEVSGLQELAL